MITTQDIDARPRLILLDVSGVLEFPDAGQLASAGFRAGKAWKK